MRAVTSVGFLLKMHNLNLKFIWQMEPSPHTCSFPFSVGTTLVLQLLKLKSTIDSSLFLTPASNPFKNMLGVLSTAYTLKILYPGSDYFLPTLKNTLDQTTITSSLTVKVLTEDHSQPTGWQDALKNVSWTVIPGCSKPSFDSE